MNLTEQTKLIQTELKKRNLYTGNIDGLYGPLLAGAISTSLEIKTDVVERPDYTTHDFAYSALFSNEFRESIRWTANALEFPDPDREGSSWLAACMAFETGETFDPACRSKVSSATGLIQFMDATAKSLGTTTTDLAKMTQVQQMNYVYKYFLPYKGKIKTLDDLYMAILWPRGIGKPLDYVLWNKNSTSETERKQYNANRGLDLDGSGTITKAEAYAMVKSRYDRGMMGHRRHKL